jgi:hypothetical protein
MNKNNKQKKSELIDNHSESVLINTILKLYRIDLEECCLEELEDVVSFFHHKAQVTLEESDGENNAPPNKVIKN